MTDLALKAAFIKAAEDKPSTSSLWEKQMTRDIFCGIPFVIRCSSYSNGRWLILFVLLLNRLPFIVIIAETRSAIPKKPEIANITVIGVLSVTI
jgi:hypothetical protein